MGTPHDIKFFRVTSLTRYSPEGVNLQMRHSGGSSFIGCTSRKMFFGICGYFQHFFVEKGNYTLSLGQMHSCSSRMRKTCHPRYDQSFLKAELIRFFSKN